MMIDAWDYEIAGAPLPQGIMFLPLCLGGALIALFAIEQLIHVVWPIAILFGVLILLLFIGVPVGFALLAASLSTVL